MVESLKEYFKKKWFDISKEIIVSVILSSLFAGCISYYVSKSISEEIDNRVAERQLVWDFGRTFFDNPKYRNITTMLENNYLYNNNRSTNIKFSEYDFDDYLDFFYVLYTYAEDKFVPYSEVRDQYAYYICITYNNKITQDYSNRLIKDGFPKGVNMDYMEDLSNKVNINENTDCRTMQNKGTITTTIVN